MKKKKFGIFSLKTVKNFNKSSRINFYDKFCRNEWSKFLIQIRKVNSNPDQSGSVTINFNSKSNIWKYKCEMPARFWPSPPSEQSAPVGLLQHKLVGSSHDDGDCFAGVGNPGELGALARSGLNLQEKLAPVRGCRIQFYVMDPQTTLKSEATGLRSFRRSCTNLSYHLPASFFIVKIKIIFLLLTLLLT